MVEVCKDRQVSNGTGVQVSVSVQVSDSPKDSWE